MDPFSRTHSGRDQGKRQVTLTLASYYAEEISYVKSEQELISALGVIFDAFRLSGVLIVDLPHVHVRLLPYIRLQVGAAQWIDHYAAHDYVHRDFVAREARICSRPFLWSEALTTSSPTQDELRIIDEAKRAGIPDGYTVPLHRPFLRVSIVNYFMSMDFISHADRISLAIIAFLTHNKLDEISDGRSPSGYPVADRQKLTRQELECIRWAMDGFKSKEIAFLLGVSVRTVDTYIANAMRKFGVKSRIELVKSILSYGLIYREQNNINR